MRGGKHYFNTMKTREDLTRHLEKGSKVFKNELVKEAFANVDRKDFVPEDYAYEAYEDYAIPIGYGATISQPTTVAFMLELLNARRGDKILDVGSGSGWTTALLSKIIGEEGHVWGVEIVPELVEQGRQKLKKYQTGNAQILLASETVGLPDHAPYDRILVSAAADEIPNELVDTLKIGGVMVIPVKNSILKIIKKDERRIDTEEYPGFSFVPLV